MSLYPGSVSCCAFSTGECAGGSTGGSAADGLSVVIPCVTTQSIVPGLLEALLEDGCCGEVLVVVNGGGGGDLRCDDDRVRVHRLEQLGLSAAKNHGLVAAQSEVVAFLDDDTVPDAGWCTMIAEGFRRHAGAVVVGGPIRLAAGVAPRWMGPEGRGYLGELDLGDDEVPCPPWHYPYGGNSAVRRTATLAVSGFSEEFGYVGGRLVASEEMDLFRRLNLAGGEVWYLPGAAVTHRVAPSRTRFGYIVRRAFWQGVADSMVRQQHADFPLATKSVRLRKIPRYISAAAYHVLVGRRRVATDRLLAGVRLAGSLLAGRVVN